MDAGDRRGLVRKTAVFTLIRPLRIAVLSPLVIVLLEYLSSLMPDRLRLVGWAPLLLGAIPYFWSGGVFTGKVARRAMFIGAQLLMVGLTVVAKHGAILFYAWRTFFDLRRIVAERSEPAFWEKFRIAVLAPLVIVLLEYLSSLMPEQLRLVGWASLLLGAIPYFWGAREFILRGKGTPSPRVSPQALVTTGLYGVTRNPMFIGILFVIVGLAILLKHGAILFYAWQTFLFFDRMLAEDSEPELRKKFGAAYEEYCRKVPRWFW